MTDPPNTERPTVTLTWPWLIGALAVAFVAQRVTASMTGQAWIGYLAMVPTLILIFLVFAWSRSAEQGHRGEDPGHHRDHPEEHEGR